MVFLLECFCSVFACELHDLSNTARMTIQIRCYIVNVVFNDDPAIFLSIVPANDIRIDWLENNLPFLSWNLLIFFFNQTFLISFRVIFRLNFANHSSISQAFSVLRVLYFVKCLSCVETTPPSLEWDYLSRISSPPGCSTRKSVALYTIPSITNQQSLGKVCF